MGVLASIVLLAASASGQGVEVLHDRARQRDVPVEIALPALSTACTRQRRCRVALVSPGAGLAPSDYRFLTRRLNQLGYLTVGVQSVMPGDPPAGRTGNIIADRTPGWQRGVDNLLYVVRALRPRYPQYDWRFPTLVGHSNGGDLSALALAQHPHFANTLVTLDNRRYPLPGKGRVRVLSIRSSDSPADPGVLPLERASSRSCIVTIANSRHNDMNDHGPDWLKADIERLIVAFIAEGRCENSQGAAAGEAKSESR